MYQGVIYVLTHDRIGVWDDVPTHEPIEHLEMFISMSLTVLPLRAYRHR